MELLSGALRLPESEQTEGVPLLQAISCFHHISGPTLLCHSFETLVSRFQAPQFQEERRLFVCFSTTYTRNSLFLQQSAFLSLAVLVNVTTSRSRLLLVLGAARFQSSMLTRVDQGGPLEFWVGKRSNAIQLIPFFLQLDILPERNFELRTQANGNWVVEANVGHSTIGYSLLTELQKFLS